MDVPPIGEILNELGLLDPEEIRQILDMQERSRQKFGQIAVRLGLVTREQVWLAWAIQLGYRRQFVDPAEIGIDTAAVRKVTVPAARALRVVPLRLWGDHLVVAAAPSLPAQVLEGLGEQTRCRVHHCLALPEAVAYHLDRLEQYIPSEEPLPGNVPMCG